MKDARNGQRNESAGLWRALEEDAHAAVLIGKSEGRALDPESVAQALMHVYRRLPQASALTQKLSARVAEMIATRGARAS
jgi:predicted ATP-grasp superfamily ATP-dependent carboligase